MNFKPMQMNESRKDVIDYFVDEGGKVFNSDPKGQNTFDKASIIQWLFFKSQESKVAISHMELESIVKEVHALSNAVATFPGHTLNVGNLRKSLENVPDNTPVVYQIIEDSYFKTGGWKKYPLEWECHLAKVKDIDFLKNNPDELQKIKVKKGISYIVDYSNYVPAFNAFKCHNEKGELVFRVDAHY